MPTDRHPAVHIYTLSRLVHSPAAGWEKQIAKIEAGRVKAYTVVVPAREDGFEKVFLGEDRWYQVRIHPSMISQLKHVAVYRTAPVSAITHYAPIRSIEPWHNTGKMVINFAEPAKEIGPLKLTKNGRVKHLQGLRYTKFDRLKSATSLDEAF